MRCAQHIYTFFFYPIEVWNCFHKKTFCCDSQIFIPTHSTKQVQKTFNIRSTICAEAHLVSEKCGRTLYVTSMFVWYDIVFFELIFFYSQAFHAEMEQWHSNSNNTNNSTNKTTANVNGMRKIEKKNELEVGRAAKM